MFFSDKIFYRGISSKKVLLKVCRKVDKLTYAPDMVFSWKYFDKDIDSHVIAKDIKHLGIVPNINLYKYNGYKYIQFIVDYIKAVEKCCELKKVSFIIFENKVGLMSDLFIAKKVKSLLNKDCFIKVDIFNNNFKNTEEFFSKLDFVFISRYHAIILALIKKIPFHVLGWAEKYDEILTLVNRNKQEIKLDDGKLMNKLMFDFESVDLNVIKKQSRLTFDYLYKLILQEKEW